MSLTSPTRRSRTCSGVRATACVGQRAKNINTVDEVPDGPYFVNRAGRMPLTPALVARGRQHQHRPGARQVDGGVGEERRRHARLHDSRLREPAVVHQVRSAGLARDGDRQRDRRREIVLGGRLSHRRVPHRAADAVEPGDRQGHQRITPPGRPRGRCTRATSTGCCRAPIAISTARIASSSVRPRPARRSAASSFTARARTIPTT